MCFAVIVGRKASADGAVLFGHNEQNFEKNYINYRMVPRQVCGEGIPLQRGGQWPFSGETYRFLWAESPGLEFSDNCFNEWGLAVAGDGCPTREDDISEVTARGDICDGGVGYMLPRLIAMLARTAQEGIDIAGKIIDRFGYTGTGRSLILADPQEAWVMSIARGKSWMARRVPDDQVVVVPNRHVLGDIADLNDDENVRYSSGLIEYVEARGWYDPQGERPFNFATVFNAPANAETMAAQYGVDSRQWYGQSIITGKVSDPIQRLQLPFAVYPQKPFAVRDVIQVLRSHLEGTPYNIRMSSSTGSPHQPEEKIDHCFARSICNIATQESVVFQLRHGLSTEIGCVAWRASSVPCLNGYTPWYNGILRTPDNVFQACSIADQLTLAHHFNDYRMSDQVGDLAFWTFYNLAHQVDKADQREAARVLAQWQQFEEEQFTFQAEFEAKAMVWFNQDKQKMQEMLTDYCARQFQQVLQMADKILKHKLNA